MKEQTRLQIGIDWSDEKHDYCLCPAEGGEVEHGVVLHDPVHLHGWVRQLRERYPEGRFAVCLETSRGALVEVLRGYSFIDVFPLNPISSNRFRESMYPSLSKDDPMDAALILEILRKHGDRLRKMPEADPTMRLLDGLVQGRRRSVEARVKLVHRLVDILKGYYPQAIDMAGVMGDKMSLDFLRRWPTWESVAKARPSTLERFYHAHGSRSESGIRARLEVHASSVALCSDAVTIELGVLEMQSLVLQLDRLNEVIATYEKNIRTVYERVEQKPVCDSIPGAGKAMAPRLAVAMGCYALLCENAQELAAYSGVAPLLQRSGKIKRIGKRYRMPKFLHQTFVELALWSINHSAWARAYYRHRKDVLKQAHWAILRSLAFKWIRIIFKCWQTGTPYDETAYIASLKMRGSPLAKAL